jgi:hypothetical protein
MLQECLNQMMQAYEHYHQRKVGIEADGMFQQKTDISQLGSSFNIKRCLDKTSGALKDSRSLTGLLSIHLLVPADVSIFLYLYRYDDNCMEPKFCHK